MKVNKCEIVTNVKNVARRLITEIRSSKDLETLIKVKREMEGFRSGADTFLLALDPENAIDWNFCNSIFDELNKIDREFRLAEEKLKTVFK